jgi:FMN reductase
MTAQTVVLVGNPQAGSRTRTLAETVAEAVLDRLGRPGGYQTLELAEFVGLSFGPEPARGARSGEDAFAAVRAAHLLIVATPSYKGSYTGLLKVFLDQFEHRSLAGVAAVPVAVAASPAHAEATAAALGDVLAELGARVPDRPLAVPESQLADGSALAAHWARRHAGELVESAAAALARSPR